MSAEVENIKSYCRQCGGERRHAVLCSETRAWADEETPGRWAATPGRSWNARAVRQSVSRTPAGFPRTAITPPTGLSPGSIASYSRPAPERKMPEWGFDLRFELPVEEQWIDNLHKESYAAAGMNSFSLAAMGARANRRSRGDDESRRTREEGAERIQGEARTDAPIGADFRDASRSVAGGF